MQIMKNKQNFKNAFNCKNCPASGGNKGCPMWWTTKVKNTSNGKEYIRGECGFLSLPTFLKEFVIASHGAAAATESMRNHFILGIDEIKKLNEENHRQLELENAGR